MSEITYTVEGIIKDMPPLATLSSVFSQMNDALNDPETSMNDFARIIEKDPAFTARLLKLANSSFYSFSKKVDNIAEAITLIGVHQVRDLIWASTVINYFKGIPPELISMKEFWEHSIATGIAARAIAEAKAIKETHPFFVAGLLHDVGRMVMFSKIPEEVNEIFAAYQEGDKPLYKVEREVLNFDHAELGGQLLKAWKFPGNLQEAVQYHHTPKVALMSKLEASAVNIGDMIVHGMQLGSSGERFIPLFQSDIWESLDLESDILTTVGKKVEDQFEATVQMFLHPGN